MSQNIRRHEISDKDWEKIRSYFSKRKSKRGRPAKDNRLMLNGILWVLKTGIPWRDLPRKFGAWQTVYKRFVKWEREGLFERIFATISKDADTQDFSIDGTYIKAHKASAGARKGSPPPTQNAKNVEKFVQNQCIGISRGGRSTKIHAVVDGLGNPVRVFLTSGEVHDSAVAIPLLDPIDIAGSCILADKAYGAYQFREYIANRGVDFCIPPKSNESDPWFVDWSHYKERALVENFFLKLKEFRHIAMRFDKLALRFLAFIHLACVLIWLK